MKPRVLSAYVAEGDPKGFALVIAALKRNKGNVVATAKELGVAVRTLYNWRDAHPELVKAFEEHALGREGAAARATKSREH